MEVFFMKKLLPLAALLVAVCAFPAFATDKPVVTFSAPVEQELLNVLQKLNLLLDRQLSGEVTKTPLAPAPVAPSAQAPVAPAPATVATPAPVVVVEEVVVAVIEEAPASAVPPVPEGPVTMKKTKMPVVFNHDAHAIYDCEDCHHPVDGVATYAPCADSGCHDIMGTKDKTVHSYYQMIHKAKAGKYETCVSCHRDVAGDDRERRKELTGCKGSACHA